MKEIQRVIDHIRPVDTRSVEKAQQRLDSLTKPRGSLGRLEEIAKVMAGITGVCVPLTRNKVIFTIAADHGVVKEGISAYPQVVTAQMVYNFLEGGAAINVLARQIGARVVVADVGVAAELQPYPQLVIQKIKQGTANMAEGPAMTKDEAVRAMRAGMDIFERELKKGIDIIGTGEMGIGNTTASSALAAVLCDTPVALVTGKGAGIDDDQLKHKIKVIRKTIRVNKPDPLDPLDVLSKVGGLEIAALAGIMLSAASKRVPIIIDGFISGAAALVAARFAPLVTQYMFAGHCSVEKGHRIILAKLGLIPLLDLDMRLGEGTGAALAMGLVDAAERIMTEMATFESASVSEKVE